MSKSTWLIIIAGVAVGAAIGWLTNWNPFAVVTGFIENPSSILTVPNTIWQTVQSHLTTILSFTGVLSFTSGIFIKAFNTLKKRSQNLEQQVLEANQLNAELINETQKLGDTVENQAKRLDLLESIQTDRTVMKNMYEDTQRQIDDKTSTLRVDVNKALEDLRKLEEDIKSGRLTVKTTHA